MGVNVIVVFLVTFTCEKEGFWRREEILEKLSVVLRFGFGGQLEKFCED